MSPSEKNFFCRGTSLCVHVRSSRLLQNTDQTTHGKSNGKASINRSAKPIFSKKDEDKSYKAGRLGQLYTKRKCTQSPPCQTLSRPRQPVISVPRSARPSRPSRSLDGRQVRSQAHFVLSPGYKFLQQTFSFRPWL